jgi:hypothetical protein
VVFLVVGLVLLSTWRSERTVEIRGSAVRPSIDVASVPPGGSVVDVEPSARFQILGPVHPAVPDAARFTADGTAIIVVAGGSVTSVVPGAATAGPPQNLGPSSAAVRVNAVGTMALAQGSIIDTATGERRVALAGARTELRGDFDPSGARVVVPSAAPQGRARATVFETSSGQALLRLESDETAITWAIYSPDGSKIMTQGTYGQTRVWDATTGGELLTLDDSDSGSSFSPDGTEVLSVGPSGRVRLRDAVTGAQRALDHSLASIDDVVAWFSPDGSTVAVAGTDLVGRQRSITLFAAQTGAPLGEFAGVATGQTLTVANLRPDGEAIVVGLPDGSAAIWSIAKPRRLATLRGTGSTFVSLAFSPDGSAITGLQADGTLLIWEVP